jgi:hypothetical protein
MTFDEELAPISNTVDKFSLLLFAPYPTFPRDRDRVGAKRADAERVDAE